MESNKKLDYDSDVIICEETEEPEIILISSSPGNKKKSKTKKHKRKVKRGVNYNNNTETLLITQHLQGKKTKFKCVININTINNVCKERCDSIVRYKDNVCKKEAYYKRILPICMRETCFDDVNDLSSCCRSTKSKKYKKDVKSKDGSLSPVSSVTLSEVFECKDISYEDVSNGSFSSASDEELETLIKRTKLREKFRRLYRAPEYNASTPLSKFQDISRISSPFSVDMNKSIHSDTTMVLNPLSSAYSPSTSLDYIKLEKVDDLERSTNANDESCDVPYSPTMTPDLIKREIEDLTSIVGNIRDDDIPYSPTFTPESIKLENISYSPIFTPKSVKLENEPYSPTFTPESMKLENMDYDAMSSFGQNSSESIDNKKLEVTLTGDVNYNTAHAPAVTSHLVQRNNSNIFSTKKNLNLNYTPKRIGADVSNLIYVKISDTKKRNKTESVSSVITPNHKNIKVEMMDLESEIVGNNNATVIKTEKVQNSSNFNGLPDVRAIDNKLHIKSEGNYDRKCEILIKQEKDNF